MARYAPVPTFGRLRWRGRWMVAAMGATLASVSAGCEYRAAAGAGDRTWHGKIAPPLPAPTGRVVRVASAGALGSAVAAMTSGTTVLIAPGVYRLASTLAIANARDVAVRGTTGQAGDVVIEGPGLDAPAGTALLDAIWTSNVQRLTLADFTIRRLPRHCVILNAGTTDPLVHNVHFIDCGQQNIKANPDAAGRGVPGGIVEYSRFEYRTTSRGSYTNAISGIGAIGWVVRHNLFRNIRAPEGQLAGPALLFRGGARDTVVDANTFIDCQRGVSFGMMEDIPRDHSGGIIRNNFFYRSRDQPGDTAFSLWNTPGTHVIHNTVLVNGTYQASIDYRWADTSALVIANNLLDASIWQRREAAATAAGNVFGATPAWFRDAAAGDLHLTGAAAAAFGRAVRIAGAEADTDLDGERRPSAHADAGADQRAIRNGEG